MFFFEYDTKTIDIFYLLRFNDSNKRMKSALSIGDQPITTYLRMKQLLLTVYLLLGAFHPVSAQRNEIYSDQIASLQVVAGTDWLSPPVVMLNSNPIHISFDDLTHEYHRYTYTVRHCEADWSVSSELFESDYINGFASGNIIEDVEESYNTNVLYTHYRLTLPNRLCQLKMSGNYQVTVYDDNNDNEPVLTACFMVVDPKMNVSLSVSTNTDIDFHNRHQQVDMQVSFGSVNVTAPRQQIKTVVMQNGRRDNARINVDYQNTLPNGISWEHNKNLIFTAGNEYHKFEVLDNDHPTLGVDLMRWDGEMYHAFLFQDTPRPNYLYDEDANGAFYIRNSDNIDNDTYSDYLYVHFDKPSERLDGDLYLNGVWTNDLFPSKYLMEYDEATKSYHAMVLLKQGYYSYQYLLLDADGYTHHVENEGNFYQTENQYQALVYYRENGGRTDQLVGYQQVSAP